jgi:heme exporter protein D
MFNFKAKTQEIVSEGTAARKEWTPEGAPLSLYNYWLSETRSVKGSKIRSGMQKENFCHFWRVVAIWAPLMFVGKKVERVIDSDAFGPAVGALVLVGLILAIFFGGGGFMGLLIAFGVALAILGGMVAVFALLSYLETRPQLAKKISAALLGSLALGALAFFLWLTGWVGLGILISIGVVVGTVRYNIENIAEWIERKRAAEKARLAAARRARENAALEFFNEKGYWPHEANKHKEPGAVAKFFRGVGDFIIMVAQIIRVKKWGICPIVEVKPQKIDYDSGWETA